MKKLKVIDLFSGCGGMSLGFQNAGYKIVAAFDNWKPACEVYKMNFDHKIIEMDLADVQNVEVFRSYFPDVIIGGPPCQDFSVVGKRDETLGRADLTISFSKIITIIKPSYVVMENVDRILKSMTLKKIRKILKEAGYGISQTILDASFYGVPQTRKRFFLIGVAGGQDNDLDFYLSKNKAKKRMTIHDYLGDSLGLAYYYRHPRTYKRRGIFSIYEPSPTVRGVNRPIPKGYKKHPGDPIAPSGNIRPLTTIERSYIQTFPRDFQFKGSKTDLEQMIGNAVPVKLAEYVANVLLEYIQDQMLNRVRRQKQLMFSHST